jgi:hypothetical protein
MYQLLALVVYVCNPCSQQAEEDQEFKACLGYIAKSPFKKQRWQRRRAAPGAAGGAACARVRGTSWAAQRASRASGGVAPRSSFLSAY